MVTNEDEVNKLVKEINIYKSSAIKNLSAKLIKPAFLVLIPQLTHLFNLCLQLGIFPESWKTATVIPLKKDGDKSDVGNLRPISLLPLPGKLLERVIHTNLMPFFTENNLICDQQGGFRPGHSTIKKIADLTDDIYNAMNIKEVPVAVFIDFKKAFDTIDHTILLNKLDISGIRNTNLKLITSYLSKRKQQTFANNVMSDTADITFGVPQGSVLGPLLFLIYVNDLPGCIHNSRAQLYADDTVIYQKHQSVCCAVQSLQDDLDRLVRWCDQNKLTINVKKTKAMVFTTSPRKKLPPINLLLRNERLAVVDSYKYLGLTLDSALNYEQHIKYMVKTISHKLFLLTKVRKFLTQVAAERVYKAMILPYFDYADIIYEACTHDKLVKLQRLQNRSLRCIAGPDYMNFSTDDLHKRFNLCKLATRRKQHLANFMFKRSHEPRYIDNRNLITREHRKKLMVVVKPNSEKVKNSLQYKGSKLWNSLSIAHQTCETYNCFKYKTKQFIRD